MTADKAEYLKNSHPARDAVDGAMSVATRTAALQSSEALCEFSVYATESTHIRDRATSLAGGVGSAGGATAVGVSSEVIGDVESAEGVFLGNYTLIDGNVTTGEQVALQLGAQVTGDIDEYASLSTYTIFSKSVVYGTEDINVYNGQSLALAPGDYRILELSTAEDIQTRLDRVKP